jgi:hypothetical protein
MAAPGFLTHQLKGQSGGKVEQQLAIFVAFLFPRTNASAAN